MISQGLKPIFLDEEVARTFANFELAFSGHGLALFIKSHDDDCRTVFVDEVRLF